MNTPHKENLEHYTMSRMRWKRNREIRLVKGKYFFKKTTKNEERLSDYL